MPSGGSLLDEILEAVTGLPPEERADLEALADEATADMAWVPNPGPQTEAFYCEADELFYGGQAGGGKALDVDELIVTPFGFRRMGDLKVGDTICAADGSPTRVIGVYPQGVRPLYRVRFQDGVSVLADAEHRWNFSIARKAWSKSGRRWKVATTAQLADMMVSGLRPMIPLCGPLTITRSYRYDQRPIDPYVLGLLLGDGYTKQSGPGAKWSFASLDPELIAALPGEWVHDGGPNYRLRGAMRPVLMEAFAKLGLTGCGSATKFVPESYRLGTAADRHSLLQGLMDTDGTADDRGHASYCTISPQLARDVAWLVSSLGGRATITTKETGHALAYMVYIRVEDSSTLFRLARKKARGTIYQHGKPKRRIDSIAYERDGEAVCIAVDHPEALYVVGEGCIVTHNTDLICGLALTEHERSLILRRQSSDTGAIIDRFEAVLGSRDGLNNSNPKVWRLPGRIINIAGCQHESDKQKWKGKPHDFKGFDEISDFTESQYRFIIGWNRSTKPGQRSRVVAAGNPPTTPEGYWIIAYWGPWLDPNHPHPAKEGELRWYTTIDGRDIECDGPGAVEVNGELVYPRSRTFIRSTLADNPDLEATGYDRTLAAMPQELRDAYRSGRFDNAMPDKPYQLIATAHIQTAMDRWTPDGANNWPMTCLSHDVALGGTNADGNAWARRHGLWYDEVIKEISKIKLDPIELAARDVELMRNKCAIVIDMGGGYGSGVFSHLKNNAFDDAETIKRLIGHDGAAASNRRSRDGKFKFANKRAEVYWRFREALEPGLGVPVMLPPDAELKADLAAITWKLTARGIQIEDKRILAKALGRSPDKGDCVVNAWSYGEPATQTDLRMRTMRPAGQGPRVNLGHSSAKSRWRR
jgi:hypothetical protein